MNKRLLFFVAFFLFSLLLQAQVDTTILLSELQIVDDRLVKHIKGDKLEVLDTAYLHINEGSTLAELLTVQSGINIRSYGLSGLATPSFRGTGSSHSALLWDGYNLQSVTNGSADLNLLPISFIDNVTLQYGGSSSLNGSGTMGGTIHINSQRPAFNQQPPSLRLTQQIGSFGSFFTGLNIKNSGKKHYTKIRMFRQMAENDYPYFNRFTQARESLQHADVEKMGLLAEAGLAIQPNKIVSLKYWYQDNDVNIPGPMSARLDSRAIQKDDFHRATLKYESVGTNGFFSLKSGAFWHELIYDDGYDRPSETMSFTSISELIFNKNIKSFWELEAGANFTLAQAETINYGVQSPSRHTTAFSITNTFEVSENLDIGVSFGEAVNGNEWTPLSFSINSLYHLNPSIQLRSKWAKSYRLPTFNDLYWQGTSQGNPNLLPEDGISLDIGAAMSTTSGNFKHKTDITLFYNQISNWIQWLPTTSSGWTPINVDEIRSFGLEFRGEFNYTLEQNNYLRLTYAYNYLNSTSDPAVGSIPLSFDSNQLIYSPNHQMNAAISLMSKKLSITYAHRLTGKQYTDDDNSERFALNKFQVSDISLRYEIQWKRKHKLTFISQVNNVWDEGYEIRSAYPMPGRNYKITISYYFN